MSDAFKTRITSNSHDNEDDAELLAHALAGVEPLTLMRGFSTVLLTLHSQLQEAQAALLTARALVSGPLSRKLATIEDLLQKPDLVIPENELQILLRSRAKLRELLGMR
jgi:hypothetical protein